MDDVDGRGVTFPLRMGPSGIQQSAGADKVEESIRIILGTQFGERVMRPRFGCNLKSLLFAPNTTVTAQLASYYVEDGLTRWEPRIEVVAVDVTNDHSGAQLQIAITYRLRSSRQVRTMLYPFALEPQP